MAAGEGSRLGADRPKAFVGFAGRVLLAPAIELMDDHRGRRWDGGRGAGRLGGAGELLADQMAAGKLRASVAGGATRAAPWPPAWLSCPRMSVWCWCTTRPDRWPRRHWSPACWTALAGGADGVVPAVPVADTVKRLEGDRVAETLDRSALARCRHHRPFGRDVCAGRMPRAADRLDAATDCASLLEQAGMWVACVEGERSNLKVTEPTDLRLAEALR